MNRLELYHRKWKYSVVASLVILIFLHAASGNGAIRPPSDPPVSNSLPAVCLSGATVCTPTDPMRGDFNGNGELDAGDLVIMHRAVLNDD